MRSAAGPSHGIDEFLSHIQKRPSNEVLVERFLVLIMEAQPDTRKKAMGKLMTILLEANPHAALQSCYVFLQNIRRLSSPLEDEIEALLLTQDCFKKMGRKNHVLVIQDEINRLKSQPSPAPKRQISLNITPSPDEDSQATGSFGKDLRTALHDSKAVSDQLSYENLSAELFVRLQTALGNFTNIRNQQLAVQSLMKAYQLVYEDMGPSIRKALHLYGRNPLLWTLEGDFRSDLKDYLLEGRLFSMGRDGLTEGRLRMCMELLTGWFDQRLLLPQQGRGKGQESKAQLEFLETALTSVLDKNFN